MPSPPGGAAQVVGPGCEYDCAAMLLSIRQTAIRRDSTGAGRRVVHAGAEYLRDGAAVGFWCKGGHAGERGSGEHL